MPLHPRHQAYAAARDELLDLVNAAGIRHKLTHVELVTILQDLASIHLRMVLQRERNPANPDWPADLA